MPPHLADPFNPAVTIPGGLIGLGGIVSVFRRMQADLPDLGDDPRQTCSEIVALQHAPAHRADVDYDRISNR